MTEAALRYANSFNAVRWRSPHSEEINRSMHSGWEDPREKSRQVEIEELARHAEALANDLRLGSYNEFSYEAVIRLVETYRRAQGAVDAQNESAPKANYPWQIREYTKEEVDAFLEADELDSDLAERYRDLLED